VVRVVAPHRDGGPAGATACTAGLPASVVRLLGAYARFALAGPVATSHAVPAAALASIATPRGRVVLGGGQGPTAGGAVTGGSRHFVGVVFVLW
jgi:hypothetical protein